jgi:hypothetical protein
MTTLLNIEAFLNIQIGERKLRDGKRKKQKNQYYWYEDQYYIVKLSQDMWMIAEDCRKTRQLLRDHTWYLSNGGYACTRVDNSIKLWHQLFLNYCDGLVADHMNNQKYDNRNDNLRVVTYAINARNKLKRSTNTSGKQGVDRCLMNKNYYWSVQIQDNNKKCIRKYFSITKLGEDEAKRQAIEKRKELELQYGYIGD